MCIAVCNPSAKPSAKLPRCEGYLLRACFYKSVYKCFRRPSAGKLLLETEEGSFREGIRVHGLLVNVLGNDHPNKIKLLCANQQRPPASFCGKNTFRKPSANRLQCGATFLVDMSTSIHVCLSETKIHASQLEAQTEHQNARNNDKRIQAKRQERHNKTK